MSKRETETTEVLANASRRRFSTKYKLRILAEMEECTRLEELGALLRREGLYSKKRGPKPNPDAALVHELAKKGKRIELEKSHSRLHVSNDNPYSEAQFKTMKYRSDRRSISPSEKIRLNHGRPGTGCTSS